MHRFLTFLTAFLTLSLAASGADVKFRTIKSTDGLSSNQVNTIFKDAQGKVWFGTASGLNRYDGYSVESFLV